MFDAIRKLSKKKETPVKEFISRLNGHHSSPAGRGSVWEEVLSIYLSYAFNAKMPKECDAAGCHSIYERPLLSDIFNFHGNVPEWANQHANLAFLQYQDGRVKPRKIMYTEKAITTMPYPLVFQAVPPPPATVSAGSNVGRTSQANSKDTTLKSARRVLEWFRNPTATICKPDDYFGADKIAAIMTENGQIFYIFEQDKFYSKALSKDMLVKAGETLGLMYRRYTVCLIKF